MIKKVLFTAAVVGTGVYVGAKLIRRYNLDEKVALGYNEFVDRVADLVTDAAVKYDEWTNNLVGDGGDAPQENREQGVGHQHFDANHDTQGAGIR